MILHPRSILRVLGAIILLEAVFLIIPLLSSVILHDGQHWSFLISFGIISLFGLALLIPNQAHKTLKKRDVYIVVTTSWLLVSIFGTLPYLLTGTIPSLADAFFETVSGFTTTGASILTEIENLPPSILLWRSLTQWIGGMGIVVLMLAVIPLLGVGGMHLFDAESPGIMMTGYVPALKRLL
ncbi:MAG: hypothetical protein RLZZ230_708 [Candidatus Parcubacteria bacterium]|jgi:trk system potassium uptake protein TrkH